MPSKNPKDLEIGWKEICENSVCFIPQNKKSQKRVSDFSGLVSTRIVGEIRYNLMNPHDNEVRILIISTYILHA